MAEKKEIVVLGAGVIGLTTALLLSRNPRYNLTILAKHMPGDYDIAYASPWAGANYEPVGTRGSPLARYEAATWAPLQNLAANVPAAGIHFQRAVSLSRSKDASTETAKLYSEAFAPRPWYADMVPEFRKLGKEELPEGYDDGSEFKSVCINVPVYLSWLLGQCVTQGVKVHRASIDSITGAFVHPLGPERVDLVVNCTGLASLELGGVKDKTLFPVRGQLIVVRNEAPAMYVTSGTEDAPGEMCYMMMRACGGGTVLGGCAQRDNWDPNPDEALAQRIARRAVQLVPGLTNGKGVEGLDIVRHAVGLRPFRQDGPRVEKEKVGKGWVVHNYGHGGFGYQASYGSAEEAVRLVDSIFGERARL